MRRIPSSLLIFFALLSLPFGACEREGDGETFTRGPFTVAVRPKPNPPIVGENQLHIEVRHEDAPVTGAQVEMKAFMPAMGTMPYMESIAQVRERDPGHYVADYSLAMAGTWNIDLSVKKSGVGSARFNLQVAPPQPGIFAADGEAEPAAGDAHDHDAARGQVASDGEGPQAIRVPYARRQLIGVTTDVAEKHWAWRSVRTWGRVTMDEARLWDVTLRFGGWIEDLHAERTGAWVKAGDPLFEIYSEELYVSQQELIDAARRGAPRSLVEAARNRLRLWGVMEWQIDQILKRGRAERTLTIYAERSGYIMEKSIVEGTRVNAGARLYRMADHSVVWIIASLYGPDMDLAHQGQEVRVSSPTGSFEPFETTIDFVYPHVDEKTRTLPIRLLAGNPDHRLHPGEDVDVRLELRIGEHVVVPEGSILFSGSERFAFVDIGNGYLEPRSVEVGPRADKGWPILAGIEEGERIVTSGVFLVSSEARLRGALTQWAAQKPATGKPPVGEDAAGAVQDHEEMDHGEHPMPEAEAPEPGAHEHRHDAQEGQGATP